MAARPRSEPFAEQACPLGVCDGSGWILGPEDVARPCECREQRLKRGRVRGVASAIPPRYRGVSFDRPAGQRHDARHVHAATSSTRCSGSSSELDENLDAGRGMWLMGDTGTGKTTLGMLVAKMALAAEQDRRHLLHAEAADADPPDLPGDRIRGRLRRLLQAADLGRPPLHRRPRRRAAHRLGGRAALCAGQRALREPALDAGHEQRRGGRRGRAASNWRSRSAPAPSPA